MSASKQADIRTPSKDLAHLVTTVCQSPDFRSKDFTRTPFPRKQIRGLGELKRRWNFLDAEDARTIACCMQLCDVFQFQLRFCDIGLTAGNMFRLYAFIAVSSAIEHVLLLYARKCELNVKKKLFAQTLPYLLKKEVISVDLHERLQELWLERNRIHLDALGHVGTDVKQFGQHYDDGLSLLIELEEVIRQDVVTRFSQINKPTAVPHNENTKS